MLELETIPPCGGERHVCGVFVFLRVLNPVKLNVGKMVGAARYAILRAEMPIVSRVYDCRKRLKILNMWGMQPILTAQARQGREWRLLDFSSPPSRTAYSSWRLEWRFTTLTTSAIPMLTLFPTCNQAPVLRVHAIGTY